MVWPQGPPCLLPAPFGLLPLSYCGLSSQWPLYLYLVNSFLLIPSNLLKYYFLKTIFPCLPHYIPIIANPSTLYFSLVTIFTVQFNCSEVSDYLRPHGCSTPGFPLHHQLPELTQTHVHWVSNAIQPSHPLSSPSPPIFNLSQHQSLFQWVSSLHQVAKVLEFQLQHQSF